MNADPEYLLSKEFINGSSVAYYADLIENPFGFNFGGVYFYNGLALAIVDTDEINVQERKIDEANQPTGPLFIGTKNEDGSTTYTATDQVTPPLLLIDTTIKGKAYFDSYADGFKVGRKYFTDRYKPNSKIVYEDTYPEDLRSLYNDQYEGWNQTAKRYWRIVNNRVMAEYGYYAGLCYSIDLLIKEYPHLGKAIRQTKNKPRTILSHPQIAILYWLRGELITKNNASDVARDWGWVSKNSGGKLLSVFELYEKPEIRTGPGKKTIDNYKAIIPLLTGIAKTRAENELRLAEQQNKK